MHSFVNLFTYNPVVGASALCGREIGVARLERGDFLVGKLEVMVKNLMATYFPLPPLGSNIDSPFYPFHFPDFDPASPLAASATISQKYAVRMLLGVETRKAQDAERAALQWIKVYFDRALDEPELDYRYCFEEVWRLLRQLYSCGKGKIIVDLYANNPSWKKSCEERETLRVFIKEVVENDLLAANPVALELMAFAANFLSYPFGVVGDAAKLQAEQEEGGFIYSEALSYCLTSRIANLGVPLAGDLLMDRLLSYAEKDQKWAVFDDVCRSLAEVGNSTAQTHFTDSIELDWCHYFHCLECLEGLERDIYWLIGECPVTRSKFLADALRLGSVRCLRIKLSREERFDLLKQRASAGDGAAGNALSRIYASNQMDGQSLNLYPLEQVEAIARLTDQPESYSARRALTIIYNTNRVGESPLSLSMEERYQLIEGIAKKGSATAAHIMLNAYLSDQLSLPAEILHQPFFAMELEEKRETLPLNLTHQERLEKLYALAMSKYTPAIDAMFDYLYQHREELDLKEGRSLLFELLMRRHDAKRARQLLSLSENQVKIIDLLSSFYTALVGVKEYLAKL